MGSSQHWGCPAGVGGRTHPKSRPRNFGGELGPRGRRWGWQGSPGPPEKWPAPAPCSTLPGCPGPSPVSLAQWLHFCPAALIPAAQDGGLEGPARSRSWPRNGQEARELQVRWLGCGGESLGLPLSPHVAGPSWLQGGGLEEGAVGSWKRCVGPSSWTLGSGAGGRLRAGFGQGSGPLGLPASRHWPHRRRERGQTITRVSGVPLPEAGQRDRSCRPACKGTMANKGHTHAYLPATICSAHSSTPRSADNNAMLCGFPPNHCVEREKGPQPRLAGREQDPGASNAERSELSANFRTWAACGDRSWTARHNFPRKLKPSHTHTYMGL